MCLVRIQLPLLAGTELKAALLPAAPGSLGFLQKNNLKKVTFVTSLPSAPQVGGCCSAPGADTQCCGRRERCPRRPPMLPASSRGSAP